MGDTTTRFPRNPIRSPDPVGRRRNRYKPPQSQDTIVFTTCNGAQDEHAQSDSGVCSPPLWGSSSPTPQFFRPRNRSLSPTSRAQAIARGQQELMDMVRNMPESSYELSLKDLVECRLSPARNQEIAIQRDDSSKKRSENRALITRSRSVDSGGFYLKMFFPLPFGPMAIKKKKDNVNDSKVSPKPPLGDGSAKSIDRDWWRKRPSSESSGSSSTNSGSTRSSGSGSSSSSSSYRSNSRHAQGGCWFCISPVRSKNEG